MKTYFAFVIFAALGCFALNASVSIALNGINMLRQKLHRFYFYESLIIYLYQSLSYNDKILNRKMPNSFGKNDRFILK